LNPPAIVRSATEEYFSDQDRFAQWLAEECETGPDKSYASTPLFASWKGWTERNGGSHGNSTDFKEKMEKKGFRHTKNSPGLRGIRGFLGVALKQQPPTHYVDIHNDH